MGKNISKNVHSFILATSIASPWFITACNRGEGGIPEVKTGKIGCSRPICRQGTIIRDRAAQ